MWSFKRRCNTMKTGAVHSVVLHSQNKGFWAFLGDLPPDMPRRPETWVLLCNLLLKLCETPNTYNREKGIAYYFTSHGKKVCCLPHDEVSITKRLFDDKPVSEEVCNKLKSIPMY